MSNMRCFPIGGMEEQHDANLKSFGTTEEIIFPLTRLPSRTCSLLSLFSLTPETLKFPVLLLFSVLETILSQILT